jgi:hypothetical protein
MFKGKLTYGALTTVLVSLAAVVFKDGVVTADDVQALVAAGAAAVGVYGRWRATRAK